MNTFGISLFKEPEQFVAAKLALQHQQKSFLSFLGHCIARSKSPPLALTYTYLFLQPQSQQQLSLNLIRFVSQLADLSPGVSMSGSLQGILSESAFLTELRHNLTHKNIVKGTILTLAREMILQELEDKYWKSTCDKVISTYRLDPSLIEHHYQLICGHPFDGDLSQYMVRHPLQYFIDCSNYEFKEHIVTAIKDFKVCKVNAQSMWQHYKEVSSSKQIIFVVLVLQEYLEGEQQQDHFTHFVLKLVNSLSQESLNNEFVQRQLLKADFMKYLSHANKLVQNLSQKIKEQLKTYWTTAKIQLYNE